MKPRPVSIALLVAGLCLGGPAGAEEPKPAPSTNAPVVAQTPATLPPPVTAPSVASAPAAPLAPSQSSVPSVSLTPTSAPTEEVVVSELPVLLATPVAPVAESREDVQRRLEAPTPEQLIEKYGSIGFLARQPESRNFVELINPFAPADFGGKRREIYNRNPNLKPGATLPRNFIRDGIRNEPDIQLISWPW